MGNLELVGNGDKFPWIPKTSCLLDSKDVYERGDGKNKPTAEVVDLLVSEH
jgi:hypothetical protein